MGGIIPLKIPLVAFGIYVRRVRNQAFMDSSSIMEKVGLARVVYLFRVVVSRYGIFKCDMSPSKLEGQSWQ
jgi:hypothetical protein